MAIRKSYSAPATQNKPTTFVGKYSLKEKAGLDKIGAEAYAIPLDMASGYVEIPYHAVKKAADGTGFKGSRWDAKIACHKFDKQTGEVVDQLPLCCRIAQAEKDRLNEKEKSSGRALSFTGRRIVIPVMILGTTETDSTRKPTIKKVSVRNGVDFSFIDMSEAGYKDFVQSIKDGMETEGLIDNPEDMTEEELAEVIAEFLQDSIIKMNCVQAKSPNIKYERTFRAIKSNTPVVGKESGESKLIGNLIKAINGKVSPEQAAAFFEHYPEMQTINNQIIDYLDLFNAEVDSLVSDWTDEELQSYYDLYLEKQGVVNTYKSQPAQESQEQVSFSTPAQPIKQSAPVQQRTTLVDDFDFEAETAKEIASQKTSTATATMSNEDDFSFNTADLEESSILNDTDFEVEDFEMEEGDEL